LILQRVGTDWIEVGRFYGTNLAQQRTDLGLGTAAVLNTGTAEGDIPLVSDALMQGKHTVWVPAVAMTPLTTNGAAVGTLELGTNDVMLVTLDYDQTTSELAQFTITPPKSWNEGTVQARFRFTAASGSGTVIFGIKGVAISNDDPIDATFGSTADSSAITLTAANDLHLSSTVTVTIGGTPVTVDTLIFQVVRNISDTLTADAKLMGVELFLTITDGEDT